MKRRLSTTIIIASLSAVVGCSQPLMGRNQGDGVGPVVGASAGVGTVVGATVGAGIGSVWEYSVNGGMVGAGLGLITGVLVGDHFQDAENKRKQLERDIQRCELELQRLCEELEQLKRELPPEE